MGQRGAGDAPGHHEQLLQELERERRRSIELEQRVAEQTAGLERAAEQLADALAAREQAEAALRDSRAERRQTADTDDARRAEEDAIGRERRRIAREIHDGLAQDLAALRLRIRACQVLVDRDPALLRVELERAHAVLAGAIQEVRRSIYALRPVALEELGFFGAVERFVADLCQACPGQVNLYVSGEPDQLPAVLEPPLFRLLQEALNNIAKHAQARTIVVHLDLLTPGWVVLHVEDDGVGFDPARVLAAPQAGHFGLSQMRERVAELSGTFAVNSRPGHGTEVEIRLSRAEGA